MFNYIAIFIIFTVYSDDYDTISKEYIVYSFYNLLLSKNNKNLKKSKKNSKLPFVSFAKKKFKEIFESLL